MGYEIRYKLYHTTHWTSNRSNVIECVIDRTVVELVCVSNYGGFNYDQELLMLLWRMRRKRKERGRERERIEINETNQRQLKAGERVRTRNSRESSADDLLD